MRVPNSPLGPTNSLPGPRADPSCPLAVGMGPRVARTLGRAGEKSCLVLLPPVLRPHPSGVQKDRAAQANTQQQQRGRCQRSQLTSQAWNPLRKSVYFNRVWHTVQTNLETSSIKSV